MRSPRVLTALLVVFVLVPAGILGWLGVQGTDRFEAELRRRLGNELRFDRQLAELEISAFLRGTDADAVSRTELAARVLVRRLPFEPVGSALTAAESMLRSPAASESASLAACDPLWKRAEIELRVVDGASRQVLPVPFDPDRATSTRSDSERLFDHLAREADTARFAASDTAGARDIWTSASKRFTEPHWKARAEIEAALLTDPHVGASGETDPSAELEARFTAPVLARVGRPWVLLQLRTAPESTAAVARLRALDRDGELAGVPLTDEERNRIREHVSGRARSFDVAQGAGYDVHRAPLPGGLTLEVIRRWPDIAAGPVGVVFERLRSQSHADLELRSTPPYVAPFSGDQPPLIEVIQAMNPGGMIGFVVLRCRDESRLFAEVDSSRRWTIVGIASLLGVIGLGVFVGRSALAREREARRLKDDFLANVSHELRTPLTSVCLHADLLAEAGLSDAQRRAHADVVRAEGSRLSSMVDDLLDFAALERGARRLEPEPVDVGGAAERALAPFRVLAEREGVLLALDAAPGELLAMADPQALGRILSNLVGNAWKHGRPSRDGSAGRLSVQVACAETHITIDVSDDGPGIPSNERHRLFERFQRGASAGKTRGVGLGLALSRDLARAMGGDLVVVEDPSRTIFRLTLPPVPPPPPAVVPS